MKVSQRGENLIFGAVAAVSLGAFAIYLVEDCFPRGERPHLVVETDSDPANLYDPTVINLPDPSAGR